MEGIGSHYNLDIVDAGSHHVEVVVLWLEVVGMGSHSVLVMMWLLMSCCEITHILQRRYVDCKSLESS